MTNLVAAILTVVLHTNIDTALMPSGELKFVTEVVQEVTTARWKSGTNDVSVTHTNNLSTNRTRWRMEWVQEALKPVRVPLGLVDKITPPTK